LEYHFCFSPPILIKTSHRWFINLFSSNRLLIFILKIFGNLALTACDCALSTSISYRIFGHTAAMGSIWNTNISNRYFTYFNIFLFEIHFNMCILYSISNTLCCIYSIFSKIISYKILPFVSKLQYGNWSDAKWLTGVTELMKYAKLRKISTKI